MRAVVQRVQHGSVRVEDRVVGEVGQGLVVLVGVTHADGEDEAIRLADKVAHLRIFEDAQGKMNLSVLDIGGGILVVSQFTLYANTRRGRRPDFIAAAPPAVAGPLVARFVQALRAQGVSAMAQGVFGAHMLVDILNDGPVTIILDTAELN